MLIWVGRARKVVRGKRIKMEKNEFARKAEGEKERQVRGRERVWWVRE